MAYIRRLSTRTARFKELVGRIIPIDNRTRWNSQYEILLVLLNLRPIVKKYYSDYKDKLKEDLLSFIDQKKLRTIKDFLTPFTQATLAAKGDSTSIDSTLFTIDMSGVEPLEASATPCLATSPPTFFLGYNLRQHSRQHRL